MGNSRRPRPTMKRNTGRNERRVKRALRLETLEDRIVLAYAVGTNLIANPGAESGLAGWVVTDNLPTTPVYGSSNDLPTVANGATGGGSRFFWGGTNGNSQIVQAIGLGGGASQIDLGLVRAEFGGWLGGYDAQNDHTQLAIQWLGSGGGVLRTDQVPTILASDRGNVTKLISRGVAGIPVPPGTRSATVVVTMIRQDGSDNDASADNLRLILSESSIGGGANLSSDVQVIGTLAIDTEPGVIQWSGDVTGLGTVHISGDGTVDILGNFSPGSLIVSGNSTVKAKPGSSVNISNDVFVQQSGTLNILSGATASADDVLVAASAKLGIDGTLLANVNISGELSGSGTLPGTLLVNSGGTVKPGNSPGRLTTGSLTLRSGATFRVELEGTTAGSSYDQLRVSGAVTLQSPTLIVSRGTSFSPGQAFVIIDNDGSDPISGGFAGLSEGEAFNIAGQRYHISYRGGTGNDVVLRRNRAPAGAHASRTVNEDSTLSSSVSRSDPDGDGTSVQLVAGPVHDSSFSLASNGSFTYRPEPHFSGTDSFRYRVTDRELISGTYTVTINVTPVADTPTLAVSDATGHEGQPIPLAISSSLVDHDGSETLSILVGGVPAGATLSSGIQQSGGVWQLSPSQLSGLTLLVSDDASFTLDVTANAKESANGDTRFNTQTFDVDVRNLAPSLAPLRSHFAAEGEIVALPPATFSDTGFDNAAAGTGENFAASIDWGDGSTEVASAVLLLETPGAEGVPTTGTISGNHVYARDGVYTVTVRVADDDMSGDFTHGTVGVDFVEQTFTVTVANAAPTFDAGADQNTSEGATVSAGTIRFNDLGTLDVHTATIDWGDGTPTESGAVSETPFGPPGSSSGANGTVTFADHVYADDGTYTVTITIRDDDETTTDTFQVLVANVRPTIADASLTNTSPECGIAHAGDPISVSVLFTDPGFDNPAYGTLERFTSSTIDWGDGTVETFPAINVLESDGAAGVPTSGSVDGTHSYAAGGIYAVTIRVMDDNGGFDTLTTEAVNIGVGLVDGTLYVIGTMAQDKVELKLNGDGHIEVKTRLGDGGTDVDIFDPSLVQRVEIHLCDGDDEAKISNNLLINAEIHGGAGEDKIEGGGGNDALFGGDGDDKIKGNDGDDVIEGGVGNDTLEGGKGADSLDGGAGSDELKGGSDNDLLWGGDGNDKLDGGKGADHLDGGAGNDELKGGSDNDVLYGGADNDVLDGEKGNDFLDGGAGDDELEGGSDNDILLGRDGNDTLEGDDGFDLLIGGRGLDVLRGGSDSDILAGGWTDNATSDLATVLANWRSTVETDYEAAVSDVAAALVIHDDGQPDFLKGEQDRDLFFSGLDDDLDDLKDAETLISERP